MFSCNVVSNILVISGFDATASAGILLDCHVAKILKCQPFAVLPALSVQNHEGVANVVKFSKIDIESQLTNVSPVPRFAKIGLMQNIAVINAVSNFLQKNDIFTVADVPLISSSGVSLVENFDLYIHAFKKKILPFVDVFTPNQFEINAFGGIDEIFACGVKNVLAKGGHSSDPLLSTDTLYSQGKVIKTELEKIDFTLKRINFSENIRGTGCALSTAITCFMARGLNLENAIYEAKELVHDAIVKSVKINEKTRVLHVQ